MLAGAIGFGLGGAAELAVGPLAGSGNMPVQGFALGMCLHADFTPFSPGANDNASGVAVALALAKELSKKPLSHTEVHLAITGCEEVGAYGMAAFLEQHAAQLGPEAVYHHPRPGWSRTDQIPDRRWSADQTQDPPGGAASWPERLLRRLDQSWEPMKGLGIAYTDALRATKRGLIALTLCTVPARRLNRQRTTGTR